MSMIGILQQIPDAEIGPLLANPSAILDIVDDVPPHLVCDLDKSWHGIHYLLTGTDWAGDPPLCFLIDGGEPVGDVEVGYGPASVLRAAQVAQFDAALQQLSTDTMSARFDSAAMMKLDIYPSIWKSHSASNDLLRYLLDSYADMKAFVHDAATKGNGLLVYIT